MMSTGLKPVSNPISNCKLTLYSNGDVVLNAVLKEMLLAEGGKELHVFFDEENNLIGVSESYNPNFETFFFDRDGKCSDLKYVIQRVLGYSDNSVRCNYVELDDEIDEGVYVFKIPNFVNSRNVAQWIPIQPK